MDILILGGCFDPPHLGHAALLRAAWEALRPERVCLLVAHRSPGKSPCRARGSERAALAQELARSLPRGARARTRVDRYELRRGRETYTYEALRRYRSLHPGARLHFLVGGDVAARLDSFKRPDEVRAACRLVIGRREGAAAGRTRPGPGDLLLPGRFPDIASHDLRRRLLCAEDVSPFLPPAVLARVKARGLYGGLWHARLKKTLPPERYRHTLAVAREAAELARRHGLDAEAAATAGLLHDCGRALKTAYLPSYARRRGLRAPRLEEMSRRMPLLLHAYVGADLARRRFGVKDPEVLGAVAKHTLGAREMSPLEKLLYVADCTSADRIFPGAAGLRRLARRDLEAAFREAARMKCAHAERSGAWPHPHARKLLEWIARERP